MTAKQKCEKAIELGFTYDKESGKIFSRFNNEITCRYSTGYIKICFNLNKKRYYLTGHCFGFYYTYKILPKEIDHKNRIRHDNRIINLRKSTRSKNNWNRGDVKGYSLHKKSNKWISNIRVNGKTIYLGLFKTKEEASVAYKKAKAKYHKLIG